MPLSSLGATPEMQELARRQLEVHDDLQSSQKTMTRLTWLIAAFTAVNTILVAVEVL